MRRFDRQEDVREQEECVQGEKDNGQPIGDICALSVFCLLNPELFSIDCCKQGRQIKLKRATVPFGNFQSGRGHGMQQDMFPSGSGMGSQYRPPISDSKAFSTYTALVMDMDPSRIDLHPAVGGKNFSCRNGNGQSPCISESDDMVGEGGWVRAPFPFLSFLFLFFPFTQVSPGHRMS